MENIVFLGSPFLVLNLPLANLDPEEARAQLKRLFDRAQRREDLEIAHVTRRDKGKRVNATFVALHHQNFESRNVGMNSSLAPLSLERVSKTSSSGLEYTYAISKQMS